ncbi:MAG: hypothetical protein A2015_01375 [Spirochaetes bacterium GWF1_31_7]|nr:MAG: hypothetical protein A2Y30_07965 [Spirochaetes bacterium GWE1_32_154]OHD47844.1 MAG: hypothetical protein A2015_01375 [Spirochaetes bacterium GWF1_31_7]OHD52206.1 MAG: hypothetical protein A2Y29_17610 [Spirochaetes bacterium GWE2_31_10]HBD93170.1 rubrerythrin [Spirochaetia bacterium]HBI36365.1 rubrerythrin [Spirochaetia bacterium]
MDFIDVAILMEIEGENFYRDLILKTSNAGLKSILTMLADDEVKHRILFEKMKKSEKIEITISQTGIKAIEIFKEENKNDFIKSINQIQVYESVLKLEKESIDLYTAEVNKANNATQKEVIISIINEEKKHYELIEYIIDLVSKPQRWVEHAEFTIKEEY